MLYNIFFDFLDNGVIFNVFRLDICNHRKEKLRISTEIVQVTRNCTEEKEQWGLWKTEVGGMLLPELYKDTGLDQGYLTLNCDSWHKMRNGGGETCWWHCARRRTRYMREDLSDSKEWRSNSSWMKFSATKHSIIHPGMRHKISCCRLGNHQRRRRKTWPSLLMLGWLWTFKVIVGKKKGSMRVYDRSYFQQTPGITWCCRISFRLTHSPSHTEPEGWA